MIKKMIKLILLLLIPLSINATSYIIKIPSNSDVVVQKNIDSNYNNIEKSDNWIRFFESKGITNINDFIQNWRWGINGTNIILDNIEESEFPNENLGVKQIGYFKVTNSNITNVDFLKGVESADAFLFYDNNLNNVDGAINILEINVMYLHNNNLVSIEGLKNIIKAQNGLFIFGNPNLKDLSPLSNLAIMESKDYPVRIDSPSQYTKKPKLNSPFCNGVSNNSIIVYIAQTTQKVTVNDICE